MLMILPSFCSLFSSRSPCLMVDWGEQGEETSDSYWTPNMHCWTVRTLTWYKKFFLSGRLVSTTPPTLSIRQLSLPIAMKRDNSLHGGGGGGGGGGKGRVIAIGKGLLVPLLLYLSINSGVTPKVSAIACSDSER